MLSSLFLFFLSLLFALEVSKGFNPTRVLIRKSKVTAAAATTTSVSQDTNLDTEAKVVVVLEENAMSRFKMKPRNELVPYKDVFFHIKEKLTWDKEGINLNVMTINEVNTKIDAQIILLVGLSSISLQRLQSNENSFLSTASAVKLFDCDEGFESLENFGIFSPRSSLEPVYKQFDGTFNKKGKRAKQRFAYGIAEQMWNRMSSDDLTFMVNTLVSAFVKPIKSADSASNTENTGFKEIQCMIRNCKDEITACFKNPSCRAALDCLNKCQGNDQVCQYVCITSHETSEFENFSKCILQRHNCMGNSAEMPTTPDPAPMTIFHDQKLTHTMAEEIFIAHLNDKPSEDDIASGKRVDMKLGCQQLDWSWKVVCGQNPAYDYFACQHQIFYKDRKGQMWYDPVFKVTTIYNEEVWRRRHYRVRRGKEPGQFYFSVLDNGVTSSEYWRILDCADDLSWAVFYYSGAASAAGTSYRGALLCSPDGYWPSLANPDVEYRIKNALLRGGIQLWELYEVKNANCGRESGAGNPPLGISK